VGECKRRREAGDITPKREKKPKNPARRRALVGSINPMAEITALMMSAGIGRSSSLVAELTMAEMELRREGRL
jgi:hypothetical protein